MLKPYLEAGQVVGTHGVRGELRVQPMGDGPAFLTQFRRLFRFLKRVFCCRMLCAPSATRRRARLPVVLCHGGHSSFRAALIMRSHVRGGYPRPNRSAVSQNAHSRGR